MMDSQMISSDRAAYTKHVQCFWAALKMEGSVQANSETEQSGEIVKRWADKGCIAEFLTPLLSHELESVRYAAAADLLNYVASEVALKVLRDIANNPQGLIAPTAKLYLRRSIASG